MSFLYPTYLWALCGLAIPIAIHLWSKKEGKTIKVGSIKLLQSADSRQSSSIQLNEYALLALRLLLIALLVLTIATPQLKKKVVTQPLTYIVESELLHDASLASLFDSLQTIAPLHVLQEGFPEVSSYASENTMIPDYWQLAQDMGHLATDSIVVFTRGLVQGIKGKRPKIHKKIEWIILDVEDPIDQYVEAVQVGDSIQLLALHTNSERLSFRREDLPLTHPDLTLNIAADSITISRKQNKQQLALRQAAPIEIGFVVDEALSSQARYLEAAFRALASYLQRPITIERIDERNTITSNSYDCLVWLSNQPVVQTDAKILMYQTDAFATSLIEKGPSNNLFYLTKTLNNENSVNEHLAKQLRVLLDLHPVLESSIKTFDKRVMNKAGLFPKYEKKEAERSEMSIRDLSPWLWSIIVIILIVERSLARYRKQ